MRVQPQRFAGPPKSPGSQRRHVDYQLERRLEKIEVDTDVDPMLPIRLNMQAKACNLAATADSTAPFGSTSEVPVSRSQLLALRDLLYESARAVHQLRKDVLAESKWRLWMVRTGGKP